MNWYIYTIKSPENENQNVRKKVTLKSLLTIDPEEEEEEDIQRNALNFDMCEDKSKKISLSDYCEFFRKRNLLCTLQEDDKKQYLYMFFVNQTNKEDLNCVVREMNQSLRCKSALFIYLC